MNWARVIVVLTTSSVLHGCGGKASPLPNQPDQLIVYSIDLETWGRSLSAPETDQYTGERFNGYPILGKVESTDTRTKKQVLALIRTAVENPPQGNNCFNPRHAIRTVRGGGTVDMVICFHCKNYELYRNGELVPGGTPAISSNPENLLDQLLSDAGVPLAPK